MKQISIERLPKNGVYDLEIASPEEVLEGVGQFLTEGHPEKALILYLGWQSDKRVQSVANRIVSELKNGLVK